MKKLILLFSVLLLSKPILAVNIDEISEIVDAFEVSSNVYEYQCSAKGLESYSFESTFRNLFSYQYLNEDMTKFKPIFKATADQMQATCKDKGYFQFEVQSCYHQCHDQFGTKSQNSTLCLATCSSIHQSAMSLHDQAFEIRKIESADK